MYRKYTQFIMCIIMLGALIVPCAHTGAQTEDCVRVDFDSYLSVAEIKSHIKTDSASFSENFANQLSSDERAIYDTILGNVEVMRRDTKRRYEIPIHHSYHENNAAEMNAMTNCIMNAVFAFEYDHSELFWLTKYHTYEYTLNSKTREVMQVYLCKPNTSWHSDAFPTYESTVEAERAFNAEVERVAVAARELTVYSRVKYIYDYVMGNCEYNPYVATGDGAGQLGELPWSAYSAVIKQTDSRKKPVCEAYAKAFSIICNASGIKSVLVSGTQTGGAHMWTAVKMHNNKWFYADPTFDDGSGISDYKYFLKSKDTMRNHVSEGRFVEACSEFAYPIISEGDYSQFAGDLLGDCNRDSVVNTGDAVFVLRCAAGMEKLNAISREYADFNCDDVINTADASSILRFCIG